MLRDARRHTCALLQRLDGPQWLGPYYPIVNPPLWEFGHIAWFQEYWCLRRLPDDRFLPSMLEHADAWYDSSQVEHASRWHLPLPSVEDTHAYAEQVLTRVLERLDHEPGEPELDYFARLALFHEDMHGEAFHYSWQTHGYPSPVQAID
jgi:iron(II)-dependent oxidoreductase